MFSATKCIFAIMLLLSTMYKSLHNEWYNEQVVSQCDNLHAHFVGMRLFDARFVNMDGRRPQLYDIHYRQSPLCCYCFYCTWERCHHILCFIPRLLWRC